MTSHSQSDYRETERERSERAKLVKAAREAEARDLRQVMGSKEGRRFVWRLLSGAGVFRLSFNQNAMQMAFNEGRRSFGNETLADLKACCSDLYQRMENENSHDDDGSAAASRKPN